jgi:hypothetical protein
VLAVQLGDQLRQDDHHALGAGAMSAIARGLDRGQSLRDLAQRQWTAAVNQPAHEPRSDAQVQMGGTGSNRFSRQARITRTVRRT